MPYDISAKAGHLSNRLEDETISMPMVTRQEMIVLFKIAHDYAELKIKMEKVERDLKKVQRILDKA
jgi:hypothetical protein